MKFFLSIVKNFSCARILYMMNDKKIKTIKIVNIILSVIWCLILPFAGIMAMFSPMMFDSPESTESMMAWLVFFSVFFFPLVIILSVAATWIIWAYKKYKLSLWIALLPLFNIMLILISFFLLAVLCSGEFAC